MDDLITEFVADAAERLDGLDAQLQALERNPGDVALLDGIFRIFHTIKGACGFLGMPRLLALTHATETVLAHFRDGGLAPAPEAIVAVLHAVDRVRALVVAVETTGREPAGDDADIVSALAALCPASSTSQTDMADSQPSPRPFPADASTIAPTLRSVRETVNLFDDLMSVAGQLAETKAAMAHEPLPPAPPQPVLCPIGDAWKSLPRLVASLAEALGKEIDLTIKGGSIPVDMTTFDAIKRPLLHMVRNACDHGIETADERRAAGKPAAGQIAVSATVAGDRLIVRVADDGRGLDAEAIRAGLVRAGSATEAAAAAMTEQALFRQIFHPGFSTAGQVTTISGRGYGLNVALTEIERLSGAISVNSKPGAGACLSVSLPRQQHAPMPAAASYLTFIGGGEAALAVPLAAISRMGELDLADIEQSDGRRAVRYLGAMLPVLDLVRPVGTRGRRPFIVLQDGDRRLGLIVREILDIGDAPAPGAVVDPAAFFRQAGLVPAPEAGAPKHVLIVDDSPFSQHLLKPLLERAGYRVATSGGPSAALALQADGARFALILSNIDAADMDGCAFAEAVRTSPAWAATPLIAVSATADPARGEQLRQAGFDRYLDATDLNELVEAVSATVRHADSAAEEAI